MKRSRSNVEGVGSSSSSKKAKRALLRDEEEEVDDEAESEMDISVLEEFIPVPKVSQLLTQDDQKSIVNLKEAEAGIIDRVVLVNFMCHRKLDVSLSPNVNFILGRNGSGKSAIMAGVVVGLGGNARNTDRGSSLKQFIRSGERVSEIKVYLRNRGKEAYRPDQYGKAILVERTIRRDGTGSYKIKSSEGKTISEKKEELSNVLDHCGIQVDNPVSLLNQDTSRHFLQKSTPMDKYKLFMKATLLEQIASDYERAEEEQLRMNEGIGHQNTLLPEYEVRAKELEEKVETFKRLTNMEDKVDQLEKELLWAIVAEITNGIGPIEQDIGKARQRIPRNNTKQEQAKEQVDKWDLKGKKIGEELGAVVDDGKCLSEQREELATRKRNIDRSMREMSFKIKQMYKQIEEKVDEKKCLESTRDNCILMSKRDMAGEKELREKQLVDLQKQLAILEGEIATAENDEAQFDGEVKRGVEQMTELRRRMDATRENLSNSEKRLTQLHSSHSNQLATFGPSMQTLVNAIHKDQHRFSRTPIGPLGSKIKLKDYSWTTAVEQVVKKALLHAFIVDNHKDEDVLRKIISSIYRNGVKPEIICSPYQDTVYDVSRNRPHCSFPTVLDVMESYEPNIINVLIDQLGMESILLIENRIEASQVIVHQRPKGAKAAYTKEGDQVLQYAHYSNKYGKLGIIRESVEAAVRDEKDQRNLLRAEMEKLDGEKMQLGSQMKQNKRSRDEGVHKVKRKMVQKRKVEMAIEELRNAEEEEEPEEDIATYESEIAELVDVIQGLKEQQNVFESECLTMKKDRLDCFQRSQSCEKRVDQVSAKVVALQDEMSDFSRKKHESEQRVKFYQDRINKIQEDVDSLETKVLHQKQRAEEATRKAREECERIATDRSHKSIQTEIAKLRRYIEQELPQLAERDAIEERYIEAMKLFKNSKKAILNEKLALRKLQDSLDMRRNKYCALLERISLRVKLFFSHFLHQRDYDGSIHFNHNKQRLDINVKTDRHTNMSKSTKNTKALSGGERSFTTVCFIISLWEAIEAPFRCLDEFDVFMDMMNRKISMGLMLEHAKSQRNRQFIFFTPQDMSAMGIDIRRDQTIKVLRLEPPERGQTTLAFETTQ